MVKSMNLNFKKMMKKSNVSLVLCIFYFRIVYDISRPFVDA